MKVKCAKCSREVDCVCVKDGTTYRPLTWIFPDHFNEKLRFTRRSPTVWHNQSILMDLFGPDPNQWVGICPVCQVNLFATQNRSSRRTKRSVSQGAEDQIGKIYKVLDHGEIELIDYMGTDEMLCRVARVSTGSEKQDLGLLDYLIRHRHTSPIEFGKLVLRIKLPIFVARQWIRHRTGSFSERSLRYQPPLDEFYVPALGDVQGKPTQNKQGRGTDLSVVNAEWVREYIKHEGESALYAYKALANGETTDTNIPDNFPGVAAELARSVLPLGMYTEWYWTTDAHNLMHWLRLRLDSHAQREIQIYGEVVEKIFAAWLPAAHAAFRRHVLLARTFSEAELAIIGKITDDDLLLADLSPSQVREFRVKIEHARKLANQSAC